MVDHISYPCSKAPVVTAVFEDVSDRHGAMAKSVDKESFQVPLKVVEGPTQEGSRHHRSPGSCSSSTID